MLVFCGLPIRIETRTGDTPSDRKLRQRLKPPQVLLTTPESLSLLLSYPDSPQMFEGLKAIVVDEKGLEMLKMGLTRAEHVEHKNPRKIDA